MKLHILTSASVACNVSFKLRVDFTKDLVPNGSQAMKEFVLRTEDEKIKILVYKVD